MGSGSSTHQKGAVKAKVPGSATKGQHVKHPKQGHSATSKRPQQDAKRVALTEEIVNKYVEQDKEIYRLEKRNVIKNHETKLSYAEELKKTVDQLDTTCTELKKQTAKEKADVDDLEQPSVSAFLKEQGTYEQKFDKEQQEYLDALQRQEVAEKELNHARENYENAKKAADECNVDSDRLNELHREQDRLLAGIFGGEYGSDLENKLESQLDGSLEWLQRVSLAKSKWKNARVLLMQACTQLAFGVKRWKELEAIEPSNTRMRYFVAAEARNNFIAAGQNVKSARAYLGKVQFPYCTPDQMQAMEVCVNTAFTDNEDEKKYKHSLRVYTQTHRHSSCLIQWLDQVIRDVIQKDHSEAQNEVSLTQTELREERLRLMKLRVKETLGTDMDVLYEDDDDDDEPDCDVNTLDADEVNDHKALPGKNLETLMAMSQPERATTPLPEDNLAAAPSSEELFGNIQSLRQQHSRERKELEKQQTIARARMDQDLQAKLNARRNKQERMRSFSIVAA